MEGYNIHQRLSQLKDWRLLQTLLRKGYGLPVCGIWSETVSEFTICEKFCEWGHLSIKCTASPRCGWCTGKYTTLEHRRDMLGCESTRSNRNDTYCEYMKAKCANCSGPHKADSRRCKAKEEAIQRANSRTPNLGKRNERNNITVRV
jgi:hypothetical protein